MKHKVELLAPAGNPEGFYGAIHAGADAVYLAGNRFGARAYADNFSTEELIECIRYAHIFGRRVYLTVNTLIKEEEFKDLYPYLKPFYEAGLDGVIVQDYGVFCLIRDAFPDMELHVSTQMTITSKYGADYVKEQGAVRIVPARELSLSEIKEIKEQTGLEIETFIHGAMCYCYSGQCLFSSILGGRSGNRGRCAQPCRLPYKIEYSNNRSEECYPLSLKDMCTIEHIPEFISAGIDSFKIEGRMKKPEYTAGVTAIYRKYIDKYYAGTDYSVSTKDLQKLSQLYIRSEIQDGYYFKHNSPNMVTLKNPSYGNGDEKLLADIRSKYIDTKPTIALQMFATFEVDKAAKLTVLCGNEICVEVEGDIVSAAQKQPITQENITKQLGKLGDTCFTTDQITVTLIGDCFYPLKAMNDLRRQAITLIENKLIQSYGLPVTRVCLEKFCEAEACFSSPKTLSHGNFHVLVRTIDQLESAMEILQQEYSITRIYLEWELAVELFGNRIPQLTHFYKNAGIKNCELIVALPQIIRKRIEKSMLDLLKNEAFYNYFSGFLVRSSDEYGFIRKCVSQPVKIYTDASFYLWNKRSFEFADAEGFCLPYELRSAEQRKLLGNRSCEKIIYGYIPLMHTANCVFNTMNGCKQDRQTNLLYLTDRYQKKFPVVRNCKQCINTIYNCVPLSLHREMNKWSHDVDFRIDFSIESKEQAFAVLQYFMSGGAGEPPFTEHTTGHEKRGVE